MQNVTKIDGIWFCQKFKCIWNMINVKSCLIKSDWDFKVEKFNPVNSVVFLIEITLIACIYSIKINF